jgi:hypothetical protein
MKTQPHHSGPSCAEVAARLGERMPELARDLLGEPSQRGRETWRFRRKGSLAVEVAGPKRGSWFDHEAGAGGDALALVAHLHRSTMGAARRWALAWLGIADGAEPRRDRQPPQRPPEPPREASPPATLDLARAIWREAVAPAGTLVETYLASRGLRWEPGAPIRFHPHAWRNPKYGPRGPAMVALMTTPEGNQPCGAHVTYLRADGSGKASGAAVKVMFGNAGIVRLVEDAEVTMGLGIAEGIETALSVMQRFQWRPVWACGSAGGIARFPVLPGIALTVFADAGEAGAKAAQQCAERWAAAGREVAIWTAPEDDFNTVTTAKDRPT